MSLKSVQFTVASHIMAMLGYHEGEDMPSSRVTESVNADPSFVRKSLSKLSKAGLVVTTRGKSGSSTLARPARKITMLDVYRASEAPAAFAIRSYPVEKRCPISRSIKQCMAGVLARSQASFEKSLGTTALAETIEQMTSQPQTPSRREIEK
jgi:Rrf2 family protein